MNPLVDHRTIFNAWRQGPAAVIRLFEDAFGKYAVWEPPTPHQLQYTIDHCEDKIARLNKRVSSLEADLAKERHHSFTLSRKVSELESCLAKNSTNSSRPPSTDPTAVRLKKTKSLREKTGRRVGGQPNHIGHTLKQVARPDHIIRHSPPHCRACGESLDGGRTIATEKRQVFDLPPVKLFVTEHQIETKRCQRCRHWTRAMYPVGVNAAVQYGPGVRARAIYLLNYQLVPYKRGREVMNDMFGCAMSTATFNNIIKECAGNLIETELEIKERLRQSRVLNLDETGLRVDKQQQWVHVASTDRLTHYGVDTKRGAEAIDRIGILRRFGGTCVHDGWWAYHQYAGTKHQFCNAHILRELNFFIEEEPRQKRWAQAMKDLLLEINKEVDGVKASGRKRLAKEKLVEYERRYDEIIGKGTELNPYENDPTKGIVAIIDGVARRGRRTPALNLVLRLQTYKSYVLRFMHDVEVPFTNNQAERDLRMVKLQQKIGGCFRAPDGAVAFCRVRSYISTMKKQGRDILSALEQCFSRFALAQQLADIEPPLVVSSA